MVTGVDQNGDQGDQRREAEGMEQLRHLLIGDERTRLTDLQQRLDDPALHARDVSRVLPEAISLRSRKDDRLARALAPTIEESIKTSVKRDPRGITDAIFPVIGPAIRKSIADAISRLVQSLNNTLEHSLSVRSLKWRLEARRTGKSFAEIVLVHTLIYRVDQVFLIHRESGLLLQHLVADATVSSDADMVSGMLTAIRNFVADSFGVDDQHSLDSLRVGDLTVWVEAGPRAVVAVVIRGHPPEALRVQLQEAAEEIHASQAEALESFDGDAGPFELSRPVLEGCLQEARRERKTDKKKKGGPLVAVAVLAVLIMPLIAWGWLAVRDHLRWSRYLTELEAAPGIVITATGERDGKWFVAGLRDPLSRDPEAILAECSLGPEQVEAAWRDFHSMEPDFIDARVDAALEPPDGVEVAVADGVVRVTGRSSHAWRERLRRSAPLIPGVRGVVDEGLAIDDLEAVLLARAERVLEPPPTVTLRFDGSTIVASGAAAQEWIDGARLLARTIDGVTGIDLDAVEPGDLLGRARAVLGPPATVSLAVDGRTLVASGRAPHRWIEEARRFARLVPGVEGLREEALVDEDAERLETAGREVAGKILEFRVASAELVPGQQGTLDALAAAIRTAVAAADRTGAPIAVEAIGWTDHVGVGTPNVGLALKRARTAIRELAARGIDPSVCTPATSFTTPVGSDGRSLRRASFRLVSGQP